MSRAGKTDWNPETYQRFRGLRLRPALDLLGAVGPLPAGEVVDLGCGNGAVGAALAARGQRLTGVDTSPAMLAKARETGVYDALETCDIAAWRATTPPALIYSNAALHWVPGHAGLLSRLAGMLAPGGWLAVQVPHQNPAPSHRLWRDLAADHFPGQVPEDGPGVLLPAEYHRILAPLGEVELWETEYYQNLPAASDGHPVRLFTQATYARPVLDALSPAQQAQLISAYEAVMDKAYPAAPDGSVLFPFRRLFFTLRRSG